MEPSNMNSHTSTTPSTNNHLFSSLPGPTSLSPNITRQISHQTATASKALIDSIVEKNQTLNLPTTISAIDNLTASKLNQEHTSRNITLNDLKSTTGHASALKNLKSTLLTTTPSLGKDSTTTTAAPQSQTTLSTTPSSIDDKSGGSNGHFWPEINNMTDLFSLGCSTAVIFGGLVPFMPQYLKIHRTLDSEGFSTYVCLTLLLANIMRIMFWFGHNYELPLLMQSFVMIFGMLAMVEICVRVKDKDSVYGKPRKFYLFGKKTRSSESTPIYSVPTSSRSSSRLQYLASYSNSMSSSNSQQLSLSRSHDNNHHLGDRPSYDDDSYRNYMSQSSSNSLRMRYSRLASNYKSIMNSRDFWQWDDFFSYVKFLGLFTLVCGLSTYLFLDHPFYIEFIGFLALFTESMLGMPQLVRNYNKKSTRGMSVVMVAMWLSGDIFKTAYFIIRQTPKQFSICGVIQVVIDILILFQVLYYRKSYLMADFS